MGSISSLTTLPRLCTFQRSFRGWLMNNRDLSTLRSSSLLCLVESAVIRYTACNLLPLLLLLLVVLLRRSCLWRPSWHGLNEREIMSAHAQRLAHMRLQQGEQHILLHQAGYMLISFIASQNVPYVGVWLVLLFRDGATCAAMFCLVCAVDICRGLICSIETVAEIT